MTAIAFMLLCMAGTDQARRVQKPSCDLLYPEHRQLQRIDPADPAITGKSYDEQSAIRSFTGLNRSERKERKAAAMFAKLLLASDSLTASWQPIGPNVMTSSKRRHGRHRKQTVMALDDLASGWGSGQRINLKGKYRKPKAVSYGNLAIDWSELYRKSKAFDNAFDNLTLAEGVAGRSHPQPNKGKYRKPKASKQKAKTEDEAWEIPASDFSVRRPNTNNTVSFFNRKFPKVKTVPVNIPEDPEQAGERRLLLSVVAEALNKQIHKRTQLNNDLEAFSDKAMDVDPSKQSFYEKVYQDVEDEYEDLDDAKDRLLELKENLRYRGTDLSAVRRIIEEELGLAKQLLMCNVDACRMSEWGRPEGFKGIVLESPHGLPILIGKQSKYDRSLPKIGQATDLWFQVRKGKGARVLLCASARGQYHRAHREDMEVAADLAAYFSEWRRAPSWSAEGRPDRVEVMYMDSRKVVKSGHNIGKLRAKERFGTISARPARAEQLARDAQDQQGWM